MDWDINNTQKLFTGAHFADIKNSPEGGWQSMSTAPRDGTIIETKNSYGVAPSYCLCRWTDERTITTVMPDGKIEEQQYKDGQPRWLNIDEKKGGSPSGENHLTWRPYPGDPNNYVDPTGGMQWSAAYWRGAVARQHGLPLDHFEAMEARNIERPPQLEHILLPGAGKQTVVAVPTADTAPKPHWLLRLFGIRR